MLTKIEINEKLTAIMNTEGIAEEFKAVTNMEEMRNVLRKNGLDASDEELDAIIEMMAKAGKDGELSEKELEEVSGGLTWRGLGIIAKATWEIGTWVAGKVYYGSQQKAKDETLKFWGIK